MRYLFFLLFGCFLFACNNRASVANDTTEPVYYDENTVVDVPEPVEPSTVKTVPPVRGRPDIKGGQQITPRAELSVEDRVPAGLERRASAPKKSAPARVNAPAEQGANPASAARLTRPVPAPRPEEPTDTQMSPEIFPVAKPDATPPRTAQGLTAYPTHEAFDALLRQYVDDRGQVNYEGLKSRSMALDKYLQRLENNAPDASWPRNEAMAYWINAYNAYTLKLIVDNYPVRSIKDLEGGNPWDVKWINIGGKRYSLNNIEHDILRKDFFDPRIHAVVNCAAASCPPLWNRAFTAANLEKGLQTRTTAWINNPTYNQIDENRLRLSKLFDWYGDDFGDNIDFVNEYFRGDEISERATISYLDYDWALNEQ